MAVTSTLDAASSEARPPRRLTPAARRRQIVETATAYFAELGFEGSTRGLAGRIGVTEPLIYRYFGSKDELVRAVYEAVYVGRWRDEWLEIVTRREMPLRDRLIAFYEDFGRVVFEPTWLRIYMFSGLRGLDINRWWIAFVEEHVLTNICAELRRGVGLPDPRVLPVTAAELDLYWLFHGGVFYWGVRREVYDVAPRLPFGEFLALSVDTFLAGYRETARRLVAAQ